MGALLVICAVVLATVVVMLIIHPLRTTRHFEGIDGVEGEDPGDQPFSEAREHRRDELESAREAKYREIRDAELDYRTGKLSVADYGAIDEQLRAEALEILNDLEALEEADGSGCDSHEGPVG